MKKNEYYEKLKRMAEAETDDESVYDDTEDGTENIDAECKTDGQDTKEDALEDTPENAPDDMSEDAPENMPDIDMEGSKEYQILIGVRDMQHFVLRHMYRSFSGWFGVIISAAALVMLCMGWNTYGNMEKIALIVLSLLFTIVQPVQLLLKAKRQVTSQEIFKMPIIYNLCKDGLAVRQGEQKVSVPWDDISKIVETRKAFFLYTSPVRAFIFPKHLIDDTKEFSDIVRKALKGA